MGKFNSPVLDARLTSAFGWRNIGRGKEFHQGVDLASPTPGRKVPIYASASGRVVFAQPLGSYGKSVRIVHTIDGKTYETNYAHLDSIEVKVGQQVKQGEQIGIMGNTDNSKGISNLKMGVHLHFEIHQPKFAPSQPHAINPMKWIQLNTCVPLNSNNTSQAKPQPKVDYSKKIGYDLKGGTKAFRIHTDAFKSKNDALKAQKDFVAKGYLKYAEVIGNDNFGYRLQSGKYNSEQDAENVSIKMLDAKVIGYASIIGANQ